MERIEKYSKEQVGRPVSFKRPAFLDTERNFEKLVIAYNGCSKEERKRFVGLLSDKGGIKK